MSVSTHKQPPEGNERAELYVNTSLGLKVPQYAEVCALTSEGEPEETNYWITRV